MSRLRTLAIAGASAAAGFAVGKVMGGAGVVVINSQDELRLQKREGGDTPSPRMAHLEGEMGGVQFGDEIPSVEEIEQDLEEWLEGLDEGSEVIDVGEGVENESSEREEQHGASPTTETRAAETATIELEEEDVDREDVLSGDGTDGGGFADVEEEEDDDCETC